MYIADRPIYVIRNGPSEIDQLAQRYTVNPIGAPTASNVYRVTARASAALAPAGAGR